MKINPFDEPNVTESKENTKRILASLEKAGTATTDDIKVDQREKLRKALADIFAGARPGDYFAILVYAKPAHEVEKACRVLRKTALMRFGLATTLGYGPRFLHSTGQLHKGGPSSGMFLQIVHCVTEKIPIPGKPYGFEELKQAQALGDYQSLKSKGRRVLRVVVTGSLQRGLREIVHVFSASEKAKGTS